MKDIAAAAGCSQTTVSFVLNGSEGHAIPEETRRKVAEAAVALGYSRPTQAVGGGQKRRRRNDGDPAAGPSARKAAATSFTDKVSRALAIEILSGRYPEGGILRPDLDMSNRYGVSRTVLREAIRVLTGKGLLEARAGVGTRVRRRSEWHLFDPDVLLWQGEAGLGPDFIRHLGEMRLILEPEAAALAARRHSQVDIDHLVRLADRMAARGISVEAFAKADLEFHLAISASAGNPFLRAVSALIEVSLTASLRRTWPGDEPSGTAQSALAHRAIVDAIAAGDCDAARSAMRRVIDEGIARSHRPGPPE